MKYDYIPHQIHLSPLQIKKLGSGLATNLKHSQMGADKGEIVVMLRPQNARKMLGAYKKDRGIRLSLSPDELDETIKEGGGFFQTLGKLTGIKKSDVLSKAKEMGKKALQDHEGELGDALGRAMGDNEKGKKIARSLGKAGSAMLDSAQSSKGGFDFSPSSATDILSADAKQMAREVFDEKMNGTGLYGGRLMKGSAEAKEHMARIREMKRGGKINIGKAIKSVGRKIANNPAVKSMVKEGLSKALPMLGEMASKMMGDESGISGQEAGEKIANMLNSKIGSGRPRGRPRKSGQGIATLSKPYRQAMLLNKATYGVDVGVGGGDNQPLKDFTTDQRVRPSSGEMTLSPYQSLSSPAMNPFVPSSYSQEGGTSSGYGGRGILNARRGKGLYGGGF
jgi:hypothetical protein